MRFPWWRSREEELREELETHLRMAREDYLSRGLSPQEALAAARREFGNLGRVAETTRAMWSWSRPADAAKELLRAARVLRRQPAFASTAILILGLSIGMTTAVLAVFDAMVRRPLPVREQGRVVVLWAENGALAQGQREMPLRYAQFQRFAGSTRTLSPVGAAVNYGSIPQPIVVGDRTIPLNCGLVGGSFFQVLGASPLLGRLLVPEDDVVGAEPVLVLSYLAWKREFGGRPDVIGRRLRNAADGANYTIVGVAPAGLGYPAGADYWIPLVPATTPPSGQTSANVYVIGRLAAAASPEAAQAELAAFLKQEAASGIDRLGAEASAVAVHSLADVVVGEVRPAMSIIVAGGALLLLIACANIGNLLIVRGVARARELAVCRALGATHGQVVRQLVLENAILGGLAGALGLVLARVVIHWLLLLAPPGLPRLDVLGSEGYPLLISIGVTLLAVLLFGLAPALDSARASLTTPLSGAGRGRTEGHAHRRAKRALVAGQVALAIVILAAAGILTRSLARLQSLDMGFQAEGLTVLEVVFPWQEYRSREKLILLHEEIVRRLTEVPGVVAASPVLLSPFNGVSGWDVHFAAEGQESPGPDPAQPFINVEIGGPAYFRTMDVPVRRGRGFTPADREGAPHVIVISTSVAERFWPGEDPLGKRLQMLGGPGVAALPGWWTVGGLVGETRYRDLRHQVPTVYFPYQQYIALGRVAIRTAGDDAGLYGSVKRAVEASGPGLALLKFQPMARLLDEPLAQPRMNAILLTVFAGAALVLATLGVYGTLTFLVRQRTRELGIRIALGATAADLRGLVLKEALTVVSVGTVAGLAAALLGQRALARMVFEVSPADPLTLAAVCGLLIVVAAVAAYLPARRAMRLDPVETLRAE